MKKIMVILLVVIALVAMGQVVTADSPIQAIIYSPGWDCNYVTYYAQTEAESIAVFMGDKPITRIERKPGACFIPIKHKWLAKEMTLRIEAYNGSTFEGSTFVQFTRPKSCGKLK